MRIIKDFVITLLAAIFLFETIFVMLYIANAMRPRQTLIQWICGYISEEAGIQLDPEEYEVIMEHSCHGGFHGDGCSAYIIMPHYGAAPAVIPESWEYVSVPADGVNEYIGELNGSGSEDFGLNHGRIDTYDRAFFYFDDMTKKWWNYSLYLYDEQTGALAYYRSDM